MAVQKDEVQISGSGDPRFEFEWQRPSSAAGGREKERVGTYKFQKELLDVEGGEELALTVDHDHAGRLAGDGGEGLHDLGVHVGDAFPLLRVVALVHFLVAVEVLAHDLLEHGLLVGGGDRAGGSRALPDGCDTEAKVSEGRNERERLTLGTRLCLDLVDLAQGVLLGAEGGYFLQGEGGGSGEEDEDGAAHLL